MVFKYFKISWSLRPNRRYKHWEV